LPRLRVIRIGLRSRESAERCALVGSASATSLDSLLAAVQLAPAVWAEPVPGGVRLLETMSGLATDTLHRWRARMLLAPLLSKTPQSPAHGRWRRLRARAVGADIRVPEPDGLALLRVIGRRRAAATSARPGPTQAQGGIRCRTPLVG